MLTSTVLLLAAGLNVALPPPWLQQPKRFAEVPQAGATFGQSVAIDGDWLAVGAPHESAPVPALADGNSPDAPLIALNVGKVYLYHRTPSGWQLHTTLTGSQAGAEFGFAVGLRGDDLIVGQPFFDFGVGDDTGAAPMYHLQGGVWQGLGGPSCCSAGAHFGAAVAMFGDSQDSFAVVTAPDADEGAAFVLHKDSQGVWQFETLTKPAGLVTGDSFGNAVAGDGKELIVGASFKTVGGQASAGTAYVFFRTPLGDWQVSGQLAYPNPVVNDRSGYSVAISGEWAAIGAIGRTVPNAAQDTGAVQMFVYLGGSGWIPWQELTGSSADTNDAFGNSIALQNKHLLVGALDDDSHGGTPDIGSAYFFLRTDGFPVPLWNETGKFMNALPQELDLFGYDVALSGSDAVVGAPFDDTDGAISAPSAGSITMFVYDQIFANGYD
jgi:hypothetical protein